AFGLAPPFFAAGLPVTFLATVFATFLTALTAFLAVLATASSTFLIVDFFPLFFFAMTPDSWEGARGRSADGSNRRRVSSPARNITNEPVQACDNVSRTHQLRKEAKAAWQEVCEQFPRKCFTEEFRAGFIDGYVDYLDRGGNAQPPLVPPRRYTRNDYMTPEG